MYETSQSTTTPDKSEKAITNKRYRRKRRRPSTIFSAPRFVIFVAGPVSIKAVALPHILRRCHATLPQSPPLTPYIGYSRSMLAGSLGCAFSLWLAVRMPVPANPLFLVFFAPAVTTVLAGLLIIVTRRKILTQVMGYLVLENGIYLLGVPLARHDAAWLELSILLDVFVGIFVMIIAIRHLNEAFHSVDVDRIASLRD